MNTSIACVTLMFTVLAISSPALLSGQETRTIERDRAGIEQLHKLDVETTLTGKADDLAKLWDKDAVRLLPGAPVEIGKAAIYATDKREENAGHGLNACYKPEIKDLQIDGDWAFEWGYFSYKAPKEKAFRGKVLRVIKRQPDGSWKFARVMAVVDENESAAPMSEPCR
jgi:ketosteroid isomerase-like protein